MKIHDINIGGLYSLPFDCYVSGYDDPKNDLYSKSVFTMPANTLFVILEKVKVQATSNLYRIKILTAQNRIGYIGNIESNYDYIDLEYILPVTSCDKQL